MIDIASVNEILCAISGMTEKEAQDYSVLTANSAAVVESSLRDERYADDERIIFLAAARAYYNISLAGTGTGDVSDFTAGDVKISMRSSSDDAALRLYREAAAAASELVEDNGFVFRGV